MAYKDSDELKTNERYPLGDYSFRIERSSVPGSTNDKIEAICTKGGKNARKSIQIPSSTQLDGWYVEANGDTASVYAICTPQVEHLDISPFYRPIPFGSSGVVYADPSTNSWVHYMTASGCVMTIYRDGTYARYVGASASLGGQITNDNYWYGEHYNTEVLDISHSATFYGKTVYYATGMHYCDAVRYGGYFIGGYPNDVDFGSTGSAAKLAWEMVYGSGEEESKDKLVGRFKIELAEAGGAGPGSSWSDPGDYDPDWEEGEPTHTLYVTVTGALSGRHNDPIVDPSYSYIPADKDTVKDYGCGGDGGHGGGGGAGASTVVIHKFATNQANSKEVTAIARRHGYGSGGGKGGKGGDGCILVYY